jgi:hypothetical protein
MRATDFFSIRARFCALTIFTALGLPFSAAASDLDIQNAAKMDVLTRYNLKAPEDSLETNGGKAKNFTPEAALKVPESDIWSYLPKLVRTEDPMVQKTVLQKAITQSDGVEIRAEAGKFSSSNNEIFNRPYVGVTGSLTKILNDSSQILVAMHYGMYMNDGGTDGNMGTLGSVKSEYRKSIGNNLYVGVEAIYEGLNKRSTLNPSLDDTSSETKVGVVVGTAF